jgi:tetratricopeptide (TPR) repeat protein
MLDSNDELQEPEKLKKFAAGFNGPQTGFHIKQQWLSGKKTDSYYNVRLVISHNGWRYKGVVHEYICQRGQENYTNNNNILMVHDVVLFQDRNKDDDKSAKRFKRDKKALYKAHIDEPDNSRTIFYLAQTCGCLGQYSEAYRYYQLRTRHVDFIEEVYHSHYRLGETAWTLNGGWEESQMHFLNAFEHSQRVEPLIKLAEYWMTHDINGGAGSCPEIAWIFSNASLLLMYPYNQILFVDLWAYVYKRHHVAALIAAKIGRLHEAKKSFVNALCADPESESDKKNLIAIAKSAPACGPYLPTLPDGKVVDVKTAVVCGKKYNDYISKAEKSGWWPIKLVWYLRAFSVWQSAVPLTAIAKMFLALDKTILAFPFIFAAIACRETGGIDNHVDSMRIFVRVALKINRYAEALDVAGVLQKQTGDGSLLIEAYSLETRARTPGANFLGLVTPSTTAGEVQHSIAAATCKPAIKCKPAEILAKSEFLGLFETGNKK